MRGPRRAVDDAVERQADKPAHEPEADAQAVRRDGEIDRHLPPLQIAKTEIRAAEGGAEPGIVEPGGMADDGGEHRAAFPLRPVEVRRGGARRHAVAARGIGHHFGQGGGEIVFRGGDDAPQFRHRAAFPGEARDMDQQAAQQFPRGVVPMRVAGRAIGDHQHIGQSGGAADHIGIGGIERVQPVEASRGGTGDAERIDQDHVVTQRAPGRRGDGINLALEVQHEGRAGVIEQVGDDGADAFAGAGRGAGQHMAVLAEPAIGAARRVAQDAQHEGIFGRGRRQMARRVARGAKMGGPVGMKRRRAEQGCPQAPDRTRNQRAARHQNDNDRQTPERENQAIGWKAGQLARTGEDHPGERDPQDNP